ncbi:hypothetical protein [Bacillus cereus]|uniref:hypothetical protein n=1 Tax=Bacillus cereus TaxID=1396 RepID=UPI000BEC67D3|nr:hypothetical protein [Bacillus cereus]PDY82780.1 hypothetical protein CON06_10275 [Bacillus cereus]
MKHLLTKHTLLNKERLEKNNRFYSKFVFRNNGEETYFELENDDLGFTPWGVQKVIHALLFLCEQTDSTIEITKEDLSHISDSYNPTMVHNLETFLQKRDTNLYNMLLHIKNLSYLDPRSLTYIDGGIETFGSKLELNFESKIFKKTRVCLICDPRTKHVLHENIVIESFFRPFDVLNLYGIHFKQVEHDESYGISEDVRGKLNYFMKKDPGVRMHLLFMKGRERDD